MSHPPYQNRASFNNAPGPNRYKAIGVGLLALLLVAFPSLASAFRQQCVHQNPTVTISPSSQSGYAGNQLTYTVTVTNNDSRDCPPSTFLVMPTFPEPGFKHTPDCFRVTLLPGESGSRLVVIRSPGASCVGPKVFRETATNESTPGFSGSAEAVFNLLSFFPNCGRQQPAVMITPGERDPNSPSRINFTVTVKNNDSAGCGGSVFRVDPKLPGPGWFQEPASFELYVPPGGSASRPVTIIAPGGLPDLFTATEVATNTSDSCFSSSEKLTFNVTPLILGACIETSVFKACVNPAGTAGTELSVDCSDGTSVHSTGGLIITDCGGCRIILTDSFVIAVGRCL